MIRRCHRCHRKVFLCYSLLHRIPHHWHFRGIDFRCSRYRSYKSCSKCHHLQCHPHLDRPRYGYCYCCSYRPTIPWVSGNGNDWTLSKDNCFFRLSLVRFGFLIRRSNRWMRGLLLCPRQKQSGYCSVGFRPSSECFCSFAARTLD